MKKVFSTVLAVLALSMVASTASATEYDPTFVIPVESPSLVDNGCGVEKTVIAPESVYPEYYDVTTVRNGSTVTVSATVHPEDAVSVQVTADNTRASATNALSWSYDVALVPCPAPAPAPAEPVDAPVSVPEPVDAPVYVAPEDYAVDAPEWLPAVDAPVYAPKQVAVWPVGGADTGVTLEDDAWRLWDAVGASKLLPEHATVVTYAGHNTTGFDLTADSIVVWDTCGNYYKFQIS